MNLKSSEKGKLANLKSIGGQGRLTESRVKKYLKVLWTGATSKTNPREGEVGVAVYTMKKNIVAILHRSVKSEDPVKQHRFCPVGESSWCKWQQDSATGTATYSGDDCLPSELFLELLRPTFSA